MFRSSKLPYGSQWYSDSAQPFGHHLDIKGMCYGISGMGMLAILSRDVSTFDDRLFFINRLSPSVLYKEVQEAKQKEIFFILKTKLKLLNKLGLNPSLTELSSPFDAEKIDAISSHVNNTIQALPIEQQNEFQEKLERKKRSHAKKLNTKTKLLLSIEPAFEATSISHDAWFYPEIFPEDQRSKPINQDVTFTAPLLMPSKLEKSGGIQHAARFSGLYSKEELFTYFSSLRKQLDSADIDQPVALFLGNYNHAITLGYDKKTKIWTLIDPSRLPSKDIKDEQELAEEVMVAFGGLNDVTSFTSDLFVTSENHCIPMITAWLNSEVMQAMHKVTAEKAEWKDEHFGTWLYTAVLHGDHQFIQALLAQGADPSFACERGDSPILLAAQRGDIEVLKTLVQYPVNIDEQNAKGATPLYLAIARRNNETIRFLLKLGANCDLADNQGLTPLHVAVFNNDLKTVQTLIAYNANVNSKNKKGFLTPLHTAVTSGNLTIVKELCIHGCANPDENTANMSLASLLKFAEKQGRYNQVESLIASKKQGWRFSSLPSTLSGLTELHLAVFFGHAKIVAFLLEAGADCHNTAYNISALEFAKAMGRNDIEKLITLKILDQEAATLADSPRRQAILQFKEIEASDHEYMLFKQLDDLASKLIRIAKEFETTDKKKAEKLQAYANEAYMTYAGGKHDHTLIQDLKKAALLVSKKAQNSYDKQNSFFKMLGFGQSQLATRIDSVIEETTKSKIS